jgi:hypothetical protein
MSQTVATFSVMRIKCAIFAESTKEEEEEGQLHVAKSGPKHRHCCFFYTNIKPLVI